MKIDHVIWDFNGTILDDVQAGIDSVNKLLRDRNIREISGVEEYRSVFRFPIKGYYEKIGFDFSKEPYEVVAPLWVEEYLKNVKDSEMFSDVLKALAFFKNKGIKQTVLSATERTMLLCQLEDLGISECFDEILGLDNIHAHSKVSLATQWRKEHSVENVLLIGDTDHDLDVAKTIGARCALVCRGHQSKEYLEELHTEIYDDLLQLCIDI